MWCKAKIKGLVFGLSETIQGLDWAQIGWPFEYVLLSEDNFGELS